MSENTLVALTHEQYWSQIWTSAADQLRTLDPKNASYLEQEYDQFFVEALAGRSGSLLEVGCGSSKWMPYFAHRFGLQVSGIDYSDIGCRQASTLLEHAGVTGEVLHRDALAPNPDLTDSFDVVISLGFVEHFTDTSQTVRSLARYLRPGGILITASPNLAGIIGYGQRLLNRPVYDVHVPFALEHLAEAHRQVGLSVQRSAYLGGLDFHEVNMVGAPGRGKWLASRILMRLSRLGWKTPFSVPRARLWSSAMAVSAAKPF